jgi:hypothetical protein
VTNRAQPSPVMLPLSPQVHQALMGDLARIDGLLARMRAVTTTDPAPGSVAARELANKTAAYAHDFTAAGINAAVDHLLAWRNLISAGFMPTFAHMSLIRTAHESALLAYWLVEPGIDAATRHARGIAAQADDYDERRKFEQSGSRTTKPAQGKLAAERLADLMTEADRLGLRHLNKKGELVLKTPMPGAVELFDLYEAAPVGVKPQWRYRLYSGYAHAKQWALLLGGQQVAPFNSAGRTIALVQGEDRIAVHCTHVCVNAVDRAVDAYERLRRP